jgi:hypothetical protein
MDLKRQVTLLGQSPCLSQSLLGAGQRAVTKNPGPYQLGKPGPSPYKFPCNINISLGVRDAWRWEVDDSLGDKGAQPCFMSSSHGFILKKISVQEAGGPRSDHLETPEECTPVNSLPIQKLRFGGENPFEKPCSQRQVIGKTSKKGHGRVGMGVDKARHNEASGRVNGFRIFQRTSLGAFRFDDIRDDSIPNEYRGTRDAGWFFGHRQHHAALDDKICGLDRDL